MDDGRDDVRAILRDVAQEMISATIREMAAEVVAQGLREICGGEVTPETLEAAFRRLEAESAQPHA